MHIMDSARLSYHYVTEKDADFLWELDQDELVMNCLLYTSDAADE